MFQNAPTAKPSNRRQHQRFAMRPMYTPILVRLLDNDSFSLEGHAYNVSEGGVQFELDHPVAPGTPIALQITIPVPDDAPNQHWDGRGPGRSVFAIGNVVWLDDSEPGPVRLAATITRFCRTCDRERLLGQLASGNYALAA
jgi:hypothetical protein